MKKQHKNGFTLIEIIISITLLALIALFMLPMSMYSVRYSKWNNIRLTAMNLGYSQVEWLKTLEYKDVGLDSVGYSPKGIVNQSLYMNDANSNPKIIEGIDYRLKTNIYWESAKSTNGDFVANATKKADITIKVRDPFSGVEKTYSVLGSLIAFEGERTPNNNVPLKVRVISGEDFTEPAKDVKVEVNYLNGAPAAWGRTDEEGKVFFTELSNAKYKVIPQSWENGEMMARPNGRTGTSPNQKWIYEHEIEIKAITDPYIEKSLYVDYPAYIAIPSYPAELLNNSIVMLNPTNFTAPEGETIALDLKTTLNNLITTKIWREWEYDYSITQGSNEYYFVERTNGNQWNGRLPFNKNTSSTKELKLAFGLKDGSFKKEIDGRITAKVEFTSEVSGINDILFSIYDNTTAVNILNPSITQSVAGKNDKFTISFATTSNITVDNLKFIIDNPGQGSFINSYGMKLVQDKNSCKLVLIN